MRTRIQSAVVEGKDSLLSLLSRLLSWQVSERRRACEHLHFQPGGAADREHGGIGCDRSQSRRIYLIDRPKQDDDRFAFHRTAAGPGW
ncbi:hypothetical protein ACN22W_27770 [Burkholderia theae]|uniref:hypothetical protein n=1 Tax=Burkholderia theae TaxID=3143496 RepID=UPI003AFADF81